MASITTQNIASASSQLAPSQPGTQQAARGAQVPTANQLQVAQATQVASQKATTSLKSRDQERSAQVPKRTEGSFRGEESKDESKGEGKTIRTGRRKNGGLDVTA